MDALILALLASINDDGDGGSGTVTHLHTLTVTRSNVVATKCLL